MIWPTDGDGKSIAWCEAFDMRVVATDNATYSINYWCDKYSGFPRVWVFTRSPDISIDMESMLLKEILPNLDQSKLVPIVQGASCNYDLHTGLVNIMCM